MAHRSTDWMEQAACSGMDLDLWFPQGHSKPRQALQICAGCPVRQQCLEWALEVERTQDRGTKADTVHGVYGGTRAFERVMLLSDKPPCLECGERPIASGSLCHRCRNRMLKRRRRTAQTTGTDQ